MPLPVGISTLSRMCGTWDSEVVILAVNGLFKDVKEVDHKVLGPNYTDAHLQRVPEIQRSN